METVFRRVFDNELIDTFPVPFEDSNIIYLDFLFYDTVKSSIKKKNIELACLLFLFSNYKL